MIYVINIIKRGIKHIEFQTYISKDSNEIDKLIEVKSIRDYTIVEIPEQDLAQGAVRIL